MNFFINKSHCLFFVYFQYFQSNITILQQIKVKYPSSIRHRDSNSQPSYFESPPLATTPGLLGTATNNCHFPVNAHVKVYSFVVICYFSVCIVIKTYDPSKQKLCTFLFCSSLRYNVHR